MLRIGNKADNFLFKPHQDLTIKFNKVGVRFTPGNIQDYEPSHYKRSHSFKKVCDERVRILLKLAITLIISGKRINTLGKTD